MLTKKKTEDEDKEAILMCPAPTSFLSTQTYFFFRNMHSLFCSSLSKYYARTGKRIHVQLLWIWVGDLH